MCEMRPSAGAMTAARAETGREREKRDSHDVCARVCACGAASERRRSRVGERVVCLVESSPRGLRADNLDGCGRMTTL
eukprot:1164027-Prymnesium_polylepis.1